MKLYSWKDVERFCFLHRDVWESEFNSIEVYPSEIIVDRKSRTGSPTSDIFQSLFPTHFDSQTQCIRLDIGNIQIPVSEEVSEEVSSKPILPLFRDILYHKSSYPQKNPAPLPCPVIAFHSFKGGVGRTLSVLSFAKAWADIFSNSNKSKLLIIDADIEAPGLTWIQSENSEETFSYLDLLSLIQDNQDINKIVDLACSKLGVETIPIETQTRTIEHIFVPTYRYKEQLLDMYASPETIVNGKGKEYALAEIISKICKRLGAYAALVDLRAGISEFSSTLLFDPRVKKYLITSTSTQSIKGTKIILEYLMKGLTIHADTILPEVFLSMIPETLPQDERNEIVNELTQCFDQGEQNEENDFTDNVVTELPFASELIHLTSLQQILRNLNGRGMYTTIRNLIQQNFNSENQDAKKRISENYRKKLLESIHNLATMQIAAEGNNEFDLLMTSPLKYLKIKYKEVIPTTVIMGAKGSGKTFLFQKLVKSQDWSSFCAKLDNETVQYRNAFFIPIITSRNNKEMLPLLRACVNNLNANIDCANVSESIFFDNQTKLDQQKSKSTNWRTFWEDLLSSSFNPAFHTFAEVNNALKSCNRSVVFLIDGLEEIFRQVTDSDNECAAIQILCQDTINVLSARYNNIGMISFLRRDMARDAITINFAQFEQMYGRAELKWSSTEALRLAVWLVSQADKDFYTETVGLDVASQDIIDKYLVKLWGLKLGKPSSNEAYSSRWILAALSDFNGQLQARDIIRFLKYATVSNSKKVPYDDRVLMPTEIKQAVSQCSREKIEEVKLEYAALKPIFDKLDQLPPSKKLLPLDLDAGIFNASEEKVMVQEGYLKRDGDKYYLPEIIRHALNFKYEKGARPKVLSLILKQ